MTTHMARTQDSRLQAFTLIELLTVVASLALLIAVLLPSLVKLRDEAQSQTCMANLSEINKGVQLYATAENDWLLVTGYNSMSPESDPPVVYQSNPTWSRSVAKMLDIPFVYEQIFGSVTVGDQTFAPSNAYDTKVMSQSYSEKDRGNGVMRCPSENFKNFWGGQNSTSYGWNATGNGMGMSDAYGFSPPHSKAMAKALGRIRNADVVYPKATFMIGEHIAADRMFDYTNNQFHATTKEGEQGFATYHDNASNALWADGHVTTITAKDLTPENFNRNAK